MSARLMWIGTYERDYPRTRVLVSGLQELGFEVIQCHRPLWELTTHKAGSFLSPGRLARTAGRFLVAWLSLAVRQRRAPPVDAVVAGYPAQPDAPFASLLARARGAPLVVDAMISLADTLAGDRSRVGRVGAGALRAVDRFAATRADLLITDTQAHSDYFAEHCGVDANRIGIVPVGAEPDFFPPMPAPGAEPHALFYGKLSPLHGLETVLAAARMPGVPPIRLIGDGQLGPWLDAELARSRPPGLERKHWVPYESLGREIADAAICLGIFGTSAKARRVVPNKVYQAMAVGRPVITADTQAAREALTNGHDSRLVPPGDPSALAEAMQELAADAELRRRLGENARRRYLEIGTPRAVAQRFVDSLATSGSGP